MVWSEEDACLQLLSENVEYMSQPKRTLQEVWLEWGMGMGQEGLSMLPISVEYYT